jgi:predicted hydrocarbon binding protein
MMSRFLRKLLLARRASFEEGEIKILEKHFYMLPIFDIMAFQHDSKKKIGTKILKLMYKNGKLTAEDTVAHFEKLGVKKGQLINIWINWVNMYGIAYLEIIHINNEKPEVRIRSKKSPFAKEYLKRYGKQKEPVDYILSGAIAGFFSKYFGKDVECKEVSCVAKGEKYCQFVITKSDGR